MTKLKPTKRKRLPMQPIGIDEHGVARFQANTIVTRLFSERIIDLNKIACWDVPKADVEQFWQMLGYPVSSYGDLSFVRRKTTAKADAKVEKLIKDREGTDE